MTQEITSRMRQISDLLLSEETMTLDYISKKMGMSLRQVRYDLNRINHYFNCEKTSLLVETDNKGAILVNDREKLKTLQSTEETNFKFSQKQRLSLLRAICAFNIEKMNLTQLSKEMNISRMTIKSDLDLLKESLKQYRILLEYKYSFYLVGEERDIYEYQRDTLYLIEYTLYKEEFEKNEILMYEYIMDRFNHVKLRKILPIISDFLKQHHVEMDDSKIYWFACTIILLVWYDNNHLTIPIKENNVEIIDDIDFTDFFVHIEKLFGISLSIISRQQIIISFSLVCNNENEKINSEIISFIFGLIYYLKKKQNLNFEEDEVFLNGLYHHLERSLRLKNMDTEIRNLDKYYVDLDPRLSALITEFCHQYPLGKAYLGREDIDFLKIYFANLFYRKKDVFKRVVLICGASEILKKRLCADLESLFNIKLVKVMSKYEIPFYEDWNNIDIILFTEDIPDFFKKDIPVETINVSLTYSDFYKLNQLGITPKVQIIDLEQLLKDLNFLSKEDQLKTFDVISRYLSKDAKFKCSSILVENSQIEIVDQFDQEHSEFIRLSPRFEIGFCYSDNEEIKAVYKKDTKKIFLLVASDNPARIIKLLLNYSQLEKLDFWKSNNSHEVIDSLKTIMNK